MFGYFREKIFIVVNITYETIGTDPLYKLEEFE